MKWRIKSLQGMINNFRKEITTNYPLIQKLTGTVNFLRKGRNVADTLWSVHILYVTPIYGEATKQNNPLSL